MGFCVDVADVGSRRERLKGQTWRTRTHGYGNGMGCEKTTGEDRGDGEWVTWEQEKRKKKSGECNSNVSVFDYWGCEKTTWEHRGDGEWVT
jgi:hypothetical protein